jgi:O-antigen ligase
MSNTMAVAPVRVAATESRRSVSQLVRRLTEISVIGLVCASVTAPAFRITADLPYLRVEHVLLPLVLAAYVWFLLAGFTRVIQPNGMFVVAAIYFVCIALSAWYGAEVLGHFTTLSDYYEFPKALLPVAFFTFAYEAHLSDAALRRLIKCFSLAILLVCFYAWAQFMDLSVTHAINEYYSSGEHVDVILRGIDRVYSTMANPNVLGQLMTWSIPAFTMAFLYRVGSRAWNAFTTLSCLATLAMTGSRYGILTSGIAIALIFVLASSSGRRRATQLGLLLLLLPIFVWTFNAVTTTNRYAVDRLYSLSNPLRTDSLRGRLDISWPDAISEFERSPIIGNGSAKSYFNGTITDSEFLDVLKEFGVIGFLAYLGFFLYPLFVSWRGLSAARRAPPELENCLPATLLAARLSVIMIVTALVMNIGESTYFNPLLQTFLWMWMGLGARAATTLARVSSVRAAR